MNDAPPVAALRKTIAGLYVHAGEAVADEIWRKVGAVANFNARLVAMLELLENIEDSAGFLMCPVCFKTNGRHESDCKLAALLKEARGEEDG